MRNASLFAALVLAASVCVACADDPAQPQKEVKTQFSENGAGRYIVALAGNDVNGLRAQVAALGGNLEFAHADARLAVVSGLTPETAAQLGRAQGVAAIHEDVRLQLAPDEVSTRRAASAELLTTSSPTDALLYPYQWNLRRIGADKAWAAGRLGSPDVTVAVLDTGLDTENLDLAGLIDLSRSRSFVTTDDDFLNTWLPNYPKFEDINFHGTAIATHIASNGIFLAGVTSRVKLLAIKVLDRDQTSYMTWVLFGLLYAADQGADVVNMSIRWRGGISKHDLDRMLPFLNYTFNYLHRKGVLAVVIPGNEAENMDGGLNFRPFCDAPHVICVSATGPTASVNPYTGPWENEDAFAPYSNYGKVITLSAPGGTRFGYITIECARHFVTGYVPNTNPPQPIFGCLTPDPNSVFVFGVTGTSNAAPQVSGLAALLVEDLGKNNPSAIKNALLHHGVDDLGEKGWDPLFGAGRINVPRALRLE